MDLSIVSGRDRLHKCLHIDQLLCSLVQKSNAFYGLVSSFCCLSRDETKEELQSGSSNIALGKSRSTFDQSAGFENIIEGASEMMST